LLGKRGVTVSTLVSFGLDPTSLGCASLPLSYISVESSHRSFEAVGILGQRPHSYTTTASPTPTDIAAAMHTMPLTPLDSTWYMDTGASSHTTTSQGNLSSYSNLSHLNQKLIVGSGQGIPIQGSGHTTLPTSQKHKLLNLNNVLHTPQIIKNLIYVRQHTTDNNVYVSFNPFGFSILDF